MSANGDVLLERAPAAHADGRTRAIRKRSRHELEKALGTAWDDELEPYRYAGEGAPVTLLTQAG